MVSFLKSKFFKITVFAIILIGFLVGMNSKFHFMHLNQSHNSELVATIEDIKITKEDLNNAIANVKYDMQSQQNLEDSNLNLSSEEEKALSENVLNSLINEKLLIKFSEEMKLNITDKIVIENIKKNQNFIGENGLFSQEKMQSFLDSINITERQYIEETKKNLIIYSIFSSLNKNFSNIAFRHEILLDNLRRMKIVDLLDLDFENFKKFNQEKISINEEELKKFYDQNVDSYKQPEYRSIQFTILNPSDFEKKVNISEQIFEQKIEEKLSQLKDQEIRSLDNIICKSEEDLKDLQTYLNGVSYVEYTKNSVKDLNENLKNNKKIDCVIFDLKEKSQKDLPGQFRKIVFDDLKANDGEYFSKHPIETEMGKHIFVLRNVRNFEKKDVEEQVKKELLKDLSVDIFKNYIDQINSDIKNISLKEIAAKYQFSIHRRPYFDIQGGFLENEKINYSANDNMQNNEIFWDKNILQNIFSSDLKKNIPNLVQINDNEYLLFDVEEIKYEFVKSFDEAKNEIQEILVEQKYFKNFNDIGQKIAENLKSQEKKLGDITKEYPWIKVSYNVEFANPMLAKIGIKIPHSSYPQKLSTQIINNLYIIDQPQTSIIGSIDFNEQIFIAIEKNAKLVEVNEKQKNDIIKAIDYNLYLNESNEIFNAIIEKLRNKYKVKKYI